VTLLGDDLSRVPWVIDLARQTYRIIRQNLAWAFGYNCAAVCLAFFGYVHPLIAAGAMVVSSSTVILNSMRLMR
jgi:cation transport ATPase